MIPPADHSPARNITWVLLRGLTREARHWGDYPQHLQATFPQDQILCPDLPGCGSKNQDRSPWQISAYADALHAEIAPITTRRIVVALSLGGMVATRLAQNYPTDLDGLVLINSSFGGLSPPHHRLRTGAWLPLLASMFGGTARKERQILEFVSNHPTKRAEARQLWITIARENPISPGNLLRQLTAAHRFALLSRDPPIGVPCLVLSSLHDRLVHVSCSDKIAAHLGAKHERHPLAGHDLPLDDPLWLTDRLRDFRERVRNVT